MDNTLGENDASKRMDLELLQQASIALVEQMRANSIDGENSRTNMFSMYNIAKKIGWIPTMIFTSADDIFSHTNEEIHNCMNSAFEAIMNSPAASMFLDMVLNAANNDESSTPNGSTLPPPSSTEFIL